MENIVGWEYFCRVCWNTHLIPYSVLSVQTDPKVKVYVKCPKDTPNHYVSPAYDRSLFQKWHGDKKEYLDNLVNPFAIEQPLK